MLIGRSTEVTALKSMVTDDRSHFVAIYGRRRIGKTFLVRESLGEHFMFSHAGLSKGSMQTQIDAFDNSIREYGGQVSEDTRNWLSAFEDLKALIIKSRRKKKVIFFDEISWMDTPNSDFLVTLENFWNGWASGRKDVVLIICASATSWMLSKVIHNKGGLYNRLTEQFALDEFSLHECEEYVQSKKLNLSRDQIMQYYMVFGGVPYYWDFLKKGLSLTQNIDRILFAKNAPLKDEFQYLYAAIFRHPEPYIKIVKALSGKKSGMTRDEIIESTGLTNSGGLSTRLEELESCGFIGRFSAFGKKKKNAVYRMKDAFTLFYYQFLVKSTTDEHFWSNQINTPRTNTWKGLAFERVCLNHIPQIKRRLGITGVYTEVNSWSVKADADKGLHGSQVDLLIVRRDQVINLCEIKYSDSDYTITKKVDESIRNKISDLRIATGTRYAIFPTIITTYGLVENSYSGNVSSVITMDDLFSPS